MIILKKIYFVMTSMTGGGAEKVVTHLVNNLSRKKFEPTLILFRKEGPNLKLIRNDVKIIDLKSPRMRDGILKLIKILMKDKPELLFSSLGPLNATISPFLFLFKGTKKIARETNIPSYIHNMKIKQGKKIFYIVKVLYKTFYKNYNIIIAQSDDMKEDLIKNYGFKKSQIVKINNLIDFELLDNKISTTSINPLNNGKINLVSAGRLTYQKGLDLLINQITTIRKLDIKLSILGTGELEKELKTKVKELRLEEKIDFLGYQENPYIYFKNSDIFVLPSRVEGFSNVALENLGLGIPIIANDFKGGINEMVVDELNGKIIDYENENNFEKIIEKVILYKQNTEEIKKNAKEKFEKEKIIKEYEKMLELI